MNPLIDDFAPTVVTLPVERTLSASDPGPTLRRPKAISYQSTSRRFWPARGRAAWNRTLIFESSPTNRERWVTCRDIGCVMRSPSRRSAAIRTGAAYRISMDRSLPRLVGAHRLDVFSAGAGENFAIPQDSAVSAFAP